MVFRKYFEMPFVLGKIGGTSDGRNASIEIIEKREEKEEIEEYREETDRETVRQKLRIKY